jgi:uncharacterized protein YecE (DUF72 family)
VRSLGYGRFLAYNLRMPPLRIGTSSFTADGWDRAFYPSGLQDRDRLTFYATKFDMVEVDATFYRIPARTTVKGWYAKTPTNFTFALKVPQAITHEKCLVDCDDDLKLFLDTAGELREKLGPMVFQFAYFNLILRHVCNPLVVANCAQRESDRLKQRRRQAFDRVSDAVWIKHAHAAASRLHERTLGEHTAKVNWWKKAFRAEVGDDGQAAI